MARAREIFQKTATEDIIRYFDFTNLPELRIEGETLSSATVTVIVGGDALTATKIAVSSPKVSVRFTGGTAGTLYTVECKAVTSAGRTISIWGKLRVLAAS